MYSTEILQNNFPCALKWQMRSAHPLRAIALRYRPSGGVCSPIIIIIIIIFILDLAIIIPYFALRYRYLFIYHFNLLVMCFFISTVCMPVSYLFGLIAFGIVLRRGIDSQLSYTISAHCY